MNELLIILLLFEIFEVFWQKGKTLFNYFNSMLFYYKKSVLLFISLHPSFYFILFCITAFRPNSGILIFIAVTKGLDIALKLSILDKLTNNLPLNSLKLLFEEDRPLSPIVKIIPIVLYGTLFYTAFAQNV